MAEHKAVMTFDTAAFWSRASKSVLSMGLDYAPTIVTKAKGTVLYDVDNKTYLDFTSGQMSALLGHSNPEIVEVVRKYIGELTHLMSLLVCEPVIEFAERLGTVLPAPLEKSFVLSTGSESVECAIKLAKCATGKFEIVAFSSGYHGVTQGVASATYALGRKSSGPVMPGHFAFPAPNAYRSVFRKPDGAYDWETEMDFAWSMIDQQSVGSLAAFVFEPILSVGGILEPPEGYIKRMTAECRKRGMLVIADEAQTGLGRTGDMFAFQREGIVPDILALSKTIGSGLPVASVSTTVEIERRALQAGFLWVTTHLNDPLAAAVASKVVEVVVRDNLAAQARERGEQLRRGLLQLKKKYWCVGDVRGRGLMQGMEIISDPVTKAPGTEEVKALCKASLDLGLSFQIVAMPGSCAVFRLAPPITISVEEVDLAISILEQAFASLFPTVAPEVEEKRFLSEARL